MKKKTINDYKQKVKYHNTCEVCGRLFWTKRAFRVRCFWHKWFNKK